MEGICAVVAVFSSVESIVVLSVVDGGVIVV